MGPVVHDLPALGEEIGAEISRLRPVRERMCEAELDSLCIKPRLLAGPVPKRRAKPVRRGIGFRELSADQFLHGHVGKRTFGALARKHVILIMADRLVGEYGHGRMTERHAVGFSDLHPLRRYRPELCGRIDLGSLEAQHFGGAGCRQDHELERTGRGAALLAETGHEAGQLGVGECRMGADVGFLVGQENTQGASNKCWVVALAPTLGDTPVEDEAEVLGEFAGTLGLGRPDRAKDLMNIVDGNLSYGHCGQGGKGVAGDQGVPLFAVLGIGDALGFHRVGGFKGCCKGALAGFLGGFAPSAFEDDGVLALQALALVAVALLAGLF